MILTETITGAAAGQAAATTEVAVEAVEADVSNSLLHLMTVARSPARAKRNISPSTLSSS